MAKPMRCAVVAGTGKMGRNIGLMLLRSGWQVSWLTRSAGRIESAHTEIGRAVRRIGLEPAADGAPGLWSVGLLSDSPTACELIIESSSEDLAEKRAIAQTLAAAGNADTLRFSNSSSILPSEIGPDWLGCHFFYPLELNALVELIIPGTQGESRLHPAKDLLQGLGFHCLVQDESSAFAVNRLLLPLQAEALANLIAGQSAATVERSSRTSLFPAGMLTTLDGIGLELVLSAVRNYARRMEPENQVKIEPLLTGLETLVQAGFSGGNGAKSLMSGEPLPWVAPPGNAPVEPNLERFEAIARASAREMVRSGQISRDDLCLVLREFWGSPYMPPKPLEDA